MLRRPLSLAAVLVSLFAVGCGASPPPAAATAVTLPGPGGPGAPAGDDGLAKLTNEQLARKLLDVMGTSELGKQVGDAMMESFRKMPNLPPGFIDKFKQNMHVETLNDIVVGVYLKHLDRAEMTAAINFYQSEQGKRIVAALPIVTQESMEAGKVWGTDLAKKTLAELGMTGH
jgi:hypothetical protein